VGATTAHRAQFEIQALGAASRNRTIGGFFASTVLMNACNIFVASASYRVIALVISRGIRGSVFGIEGSLLSAFGRKDDATLAESYRWQYRDGVRARRLGRGYVTATTAATCGRRSRALRGLQRRRASRCAHRAAGRLGLSGDDPFCNPTSPVKKESSLRLVAVLQLCVVVPRLGLLPLGQTGPPKFEHRLVRVGRHPRSSCSQNYEWRRTSNTAS
jgi:hypothetical protein